MELEMSCLRTKGNHKTPFKTRAVFHERSIYLRDFPIVIAEDPTYFTPERGFHICTS